MSPTTNEELVAQFMSNAALAVATVERIPRETDALTAALEKAVSGYEAVLVAPPDDVDPNLFNGFLSHPQVIRHPTGEQLKSIKVGVTDAFCGVASTGSVCVSVGNRLTSPASMLTQKHVVVLDSTTIVPRPRDVFSDDVVSGKGSHRSFSFITGPSATADMGPLVRGVHGPGKLHIIILG